MTVDTQEPARNLPNYHALVSAAFHPFVHTPDGRTHELSRSNAAILDGLGENPTRLPLLADAVDSALADLGQNSSPDLKRELRAVELMYTLTTPGAGLLGFDALRQRLSEPPHERGLEGPVSERAARELVLRGLPRYHNIPPA